MMNDIPNFTDVEYFEKTVLFKALNYPETRKQLRLEPEYFSDQRHSAIAERLLSDLGFDKHQLISEAVKAPNVYGDYEFVQQIAFLDIPTNKGFMADQEQVLEHYKRRELAKAIEEYTNEQNLEKRMDIRNIIDHLEKIDLVQGDKKLDTLAEIFNSLYEKEATTIIKTGINSLDDLIAGFEPGQLNLIAARPSMGKTALALQMSRNMQNENTEVIFFSLETTELNVTQRILSNMTGVDLRKFKSPSENMTNDDIDKVIAAIELYHKANIKIIDDARVTPNKVRAAANNIPEGKDGILFIDYIQLMDADTKNHKERRSVIEEVSRELKIIAKDMDVTIVALSQLSRASDNRQDKRPVLSDLRESGQLEQDANIVAFCYRDDYYIREESTDTSNGEGADMEIIVAKNKDGPIGTALTQFYKTVQRIYSG